MRNSTKDASDLLSDLPLCNHVTTLLTCMYTLDLLRKLCGVLSLSPLFSRTLSPREVNRLKEQAADALRLRDRMHRLEQEVRGKRLPLTSLSVSFSESALKTGFKIHNLNFATVP